MKRITIKTYLPDGAFAGAWPGATFAGFSKSLDAGAGECEIALNRPFDYAGQDLQLGNRVDVYVADQETVGTADGERLVYRGYVAAISPRADGKGENVAVRILGYYTRLSLDFLKNGAQTTLYTDENDGLTTTGPPAPSAADLGLIVRAIIDRYRAETGDESVRWTPESVPDAGVTALYAFKRKTYREALDRVRDMAPEGWHWYVDATGLVSFREKGSVAHSLAVGRDISSIRVERNLESVRNVLLVWNGETGAGVVYKHYEDAASISRYGRRALATVDSGIGDEAAADSLAARFLADMREPDVRVIAEVVDSNGGRGYDIESIEPGDTITVLNFDAENAETVRAGLAVTRVDYRPDGATVEAMLVRSGVLDAQEAARRRLEEAESSDIPESYT